LFQREIKAISIQLRESAVVGFFFFFFVLVLLIVLIFFSNIITHSI
jgi:hypothetical protein